MGLIFVLSMSVVMNASGVEPEPTPVGPLITGKVKISKKKGTRREQKETEGSEAPGRFEADTILKSPYTRDGQPLEVDPD